MEVGTRKELKKLIRSGAVTVNGGIVRDPGAAVGDGDDVICKGKAVKHASWQYLMLHKPAGLVSATRDPRESTVLDLIRDPAAFAGSPDEIPDLRGDLFPAGRLDKDTTGLLLLTNDGALAHRLLSPTSHVDKTYRAVVTGTVTQADVDAFREGILLDSGTDEPWTTLPAVLEIVGARKNDASTYGNASGPAISADGQTSNPASSDEQENADREGTEVLVTIREGKFHQIKKMFAARGKEVLSLHCISMGPLRLDPALPEGKYRLLTTDELNALFTSRSSLSSS